MAVRLRWEFIFLLIACYAPILFTSHAAESQQDLYKLLGVTKQATTKELKQAYRRKALDTHPDKNRHLPPEEAAESFRQVVHAFEILSEPTARRRYDQTGRTDGASSGNGGNGSQGQQRGGGTQFHGFQWNYRRKPVKLKDKFEVQEAMSRVLHVVSLEQLRTIMLDDDDRLERNILMVFCTPQAVEQHVDDEMVFPYPFAAMSSQGIWWEDLLQTVKVRFHKKNDLTEHFNIPTGDEMRQRGKPIFVFGKRGQSIDAPWAQLETNNRQEFETWVWTQVEVELIFVNHHDHPVEIYWIHGSTAHISQVLEPQKSGHHTTMLSHEWYVRDARVDKRKDSPGRYKLTNESSLGSWKITNDTSPQIITIETPVCYDLSGHCLFWKRQGACSKNPTFMCEVCQLSCKQSCGTCKEEKIDNGKEDGGTHEEL
jgi:curved DNA-binding protein CbpA